MKFTTGIKALAIMAVAAGSAAASTPLCCNLVGTVDDPLIAAALLALGLTLTPDGLKVGVGCIPDRGTVGVCPTGRTATSCNGVLLGGLVGTGCS